MEKNVSKFDEDFIENYDEGSHGLIFKKVHRVIQFNQEVWLKPYIEMNTKLRTETKNDFEKYFLKLMNNSV